MVINKQKDTNLQYESWNKQAEHCFVWSELETRMTGVDAALCNVANGYKRQIHHTESMKNEDQLYIETLRNIQ